MLRTVWSVVLGGLLGTTLACSRSASPPPPRIISPDGQHVAIVVRQGGKMAVDLDGHVGPLYALISDKSLRFSPDSKHLAYAASNLDDELKGFVVLDGRVGPELALMDTSDLILVFSPDSKRLAYVVSREVHPIVVMNGKDGPADPDLDDPPYVTAHQMVVDGNPGPLYSAVGPPIFSHDGKRLAYRAAKGDLWWLIVSDGQPGPEYQGIADPVFSPDGSHLAYKATKEPDKCVIVLDGRPGPQYEDVDDEPTFSPDSRHLAYAATLGLKSRVVIDGRLGPEYDVILEIVFSPDSAHVAYVALNGEKEFVVLDGQAGPEYDDLSPDLVFDTRDRVTYTAVVKGATYHVTQSSNGHATTVK